MDDQRAIGAGSASLSALWLEIAISFGLLSATIDNTYRAFTEPSFLSIFLAVVIGSAFVADLISVRRRLLKNKFDLTT